MSTFLPAGLVVGVLGGIFFGGIFSSTPGGITIWAPAAQGNDTTATNVSISFRRLPILVLCYFV
ncbi:MAG: hypothetical protein ISS69_16550 [Phycisphaerae bacterium]|nr:hypothetical protein [Phycisphaerae bacterium]